MDTILNYFFVISSNHQVPTSNHTFRLPAVRVTLLPPSSSSFRQLQLFQWIDHNVFVTSYSPATRTIHSVGQRPRRPARQRHAVLPPSTMGASSVCTLNSPPRLPSLQPWFISGGMTPPSYFWGKMAAPNIRLAGFSASAPAQLAWVSRYASSNFRPWVKGTKEGEKKRLNS